MGDSSEGSCSRSNNSSAGSSGISIKRGSGLRGCPAPVTDSPCVEARADAGLDPGLGTPELRDGGGGGAARRTESTFGARLEGGGSDGATGGSDALGPSPGALARGRGGGPPVLGLAGTSGPAPLSSAFGLTAGTTV